MHANASRKAEKVSEPVLAGKANKALPQQLAKVYSAGALAAQSWDESAKLMDELGIGGSQDGKPVRVPAFMAHITATAPAPTTSTAKITAISSATVTSTTTSTASTMPAPAKPARPRLMAVGPENLAEEFVDTAVDYLDRPGGADHDGFWNYVELGLDALHANPQSETRKGIAQAVMKGPSLDQMSKLQRTALLVSAARVDMVGPFLAKSTAKPALNEITQLLHAAMGIYSEGGECFWAGPISHRSIQHIADFMKTHEAALGKSACVKLVRQLDPIANWIAASPFQGRSALQDTFQEAFAPFRRT